MAPPNDQSDSARTLPRPEVNPLLNPLLADNLGRWAEVYFTAPPEKREEAVFELIRELEAEKAGGERRAGEPQSNPRLPVAFPTPEVVAAHDRLLAHCQACGHDNPPSHQFCGMCGAKLERNLSPAELNDAGLRPQRDVENGQFAPVHAGSNGSGSAPKSDAAEPVQAFEQRAVNEAAPSANDFSLFRSISEGNFTEDELDETDEQSPLRQYRVYIGAALAIILLAVGYMAWRSSQTSQSSGHGSTPPPAAAKEATTPATSPAPKVDEPERTASPLKAADASAPKGVDVSGNKSGPNVESSVKTPATEPTASNPPGPAATGNGNEELAIAQRYLSGGNGLSRNSAEAAQWLWKAVAKHNSEATLILADLYLKGDGVSKNCDQARVLLDSAARKGISRAGERLRNLQAFGCQ